MIRELRKDDFSSWLEMRMRLYPEYEEEVLQSEIEIIFRDRSIVGELGYCLLGYESDGVLGGFIETSIRKELPGYSSVPVGYIESLYVAPEHRRKGVASQLVDMSHSWVRKTNEQPFYVDTDIDREDAIRFYTSFGFSKQGVIDGAVIMAKQ